MVSDPHALAGAEDAKAAAAAKGRGEGRGEVGETGPEGARRGA